MSGINKVILVGRLGGDPELKQVGQSQVAQFSLATSESWTDKNNQKQERVEWHRVVFWSKPAEIIKQYAKKGSQLYVEGRLQTRSWEKDGQKHYATEIVGTGFQFLGNAPSRENQQRDGGDPGPEPSFNDKEEIPF